MCVQPRALLITDARCALSRASRDVKFHKYCNIKMFETRFGSSFTFRADAQTNKTRMIQKFQTKREQNRLDWTISRTMDRVRSIDLYCARIVFNFGAEKKAVLLSHVIRYRVKQPQPCRLRDIIFCPLLAGIVMMWKLGVDNDNSDKRTTKKKTCCQAHRRLQSAGVCCWAS